MAKKETTALGRRANFLCFRIMKIHEGQILLGILFIASGFALRLIARREKDEQKRRQMLKISLALFIVGGAFVVIEPMFLLGVNNR